MSRLLELESNKTDRIKWIMHQRIRILIVDYSNLRWDKDFMSILKVLSEVLADEKEVRLLMNVTGCYVSGTVMFDSFKIIKPVRHHVVRRAIVGAAGYKLHFFCRPRQLLAKTRSL